MNVWSTRFLSVPPPAGFPRLLAAAHEIQVDTNYHHSGKYRQAERHTHFQWTLKGVGQCCLAGKTFSVPSGFGFLGQAANKEMSYGYPPGCTEPWEFVWVAFESRLAKPMVDRLLDTFGPLFPIGKSHAVLDRIMALRRFSGTRTAMAPGGGASLVLDLLGALLREMLPEPVDTGRATLVTRAQKVIDKQISSGMNITELADQLEVSREHLARAFRSHLGMTPLEYVQHSRLRKACRLLLESPLPIGQIAKALGFASHQHFCRTFRRIMQMPPSQFRRVGTLPYW